MPSGTENTVNESDDPCRRDCILSELVQPQSALKPAAPFDDFIVQEKCDRILDGK